MPNLSNVTASKAQKDLAAEIDRLKAALSDLLLRLDTLDVETLQRYQKRTMELAVLIERRPSSHG